MPLQTTVVFSDVDGVLRYPHALDSFRDAAHALHSLRSDGVSIVLCSGKTRAEIEEIQHELGICHPFISEKGGAAFIPPHYFAFDVPGAREVGGYQTVEFGLAYRDIVQALHRVARRQGIEILAFSDLSVAEVAKDCNMPLLQARLATLREYSECFRVRDGSDATRARLFKALTSEGLRTVRGRHYDTVCAPGDIAVGVKFLGSLYERAHGTVATLGLADMLADASVLRLVNRRVLVSDDDSAHCGVDVVGWAEAIVDSVQELRRAAPEPPAPPIPDRASVGGNTRGDVRRGGG